MEVLTRQEAIRECKRLWKPSLKNPSLRKKDLLELYPKAKQYREGCPLCEYVSQQITINCRLYCPLYVQFRKGCGELCFSTDAGAFARKVMKLKE